MTLSNKEQTNAPRCAVRGLVAPRAMCGSVIVGGEFCGSDKPCQHKVEFKPPTPPTILNAFQSVRPRGVDRPSAVPVKQVAGKPLSLSGSLPRILDAAGRLRPAEQAVAQRGFVIENRQQSRASRDKRHALVKGGL